MNVNRDDKVPMLVLPGIDFNNLVEVASIVSG